MPSNLLINHMRIAQVNDIMFLIGHLPNDTLIQRMVAFRDDINFYPMSKLDRSEE